MEGYLTEFEYMARNSLGVASYVLNSGRNYEDLDIETARKLFVQDSYKFGAGMPSQLPVDDVGDEDMVDITAFNPIPRGVDDDEDMVWINGFSLMPLNDLTDDASLAAPIPVEIVDLSTGDEVEPMESIDLTSEDDDGEIDPTSDESDTDDDEYSDSTDSDSSISGLSSGSGSTNGIYCPCSKCLESD